MVNKRNKGYRVLMKVSVSESEVESGCLAVAGVFVSVYEEKNSNKLPRQMFTRQNIPAITI